MKEIYIYTDGSCIGNPGPGGWAAIIFDGEPDLTAQPIVELTGKAPDTTNNRMEMQAIIEALNWLRKNHEEKIQDANIKIFSDSNLIIQTLNQGWKRKANTDLWAEMDKSRAWLNISWNWVKGHSTNPFNNRVDELANSAAQSA